MKLNYDFSALDEVKKNKYFRLAIAGVCLNTICSPFIFPDYIYQKISGIALMLMFLFTLITWKDKDTEFLIRMISIMLVLIATAFIQILYIKLITCLVLAVYVLLTVKKYSKDESVK